MACGAKPPIYSPTYTIVIGGAPSSVRLSRTLVTPDAILLFPQKDNGIVRISRYEEVLIRLTEEYRGLIAREANLIRAKALEAVSEGLGAALQRALDDAKARSQMYYIESLKAKFDNFRAKLFGTGA